MVFAAPTHRTLLVSRRVVLPDGERLVIEPAGVLIEGGYIQAVWPLDIEGNGADALAVRAGAQLVDFGQHLMTPAFVNAHTHLSLSALRAVDLEPATVGNMVERFFFQIEALMQPQDIRAFARLGGLESILNGVGLVWDHYYEAKAVAEGLADIGLCGVVAPTLQDRRGPRMERWEQGLSDTAQIAEDGRLSARGIFAAVGPHATDTVSESLWHRGLELARQYNLPLHAHLAQSVDEVRRIYESQGCSPVEWLMRLGVFSDNLPSVWAHALYVSRPELSVLRETRQTLVYCPYSQLVFGFPARVSEWTEAGVSWVVATDCAASNDSMNLQKELRYVEGQRTMGTTFSSAYEQFLETGSLSDAEMVWQRREAFSRLGATGREKVGRSQDTLGRVWRRPGALHPHFSVGELVRGALANIVVWDTNHPCFWPGEAPFRTLSMGDTSLAIHAMYIHGRPMGIAGDFHRSLLQSELYRDAVGEASERLARLLDAV